MDNLDAIGLRRIERETMNDQVYEEIRRVIMGGRLQPGAAVTIRGLAAQLGTSTMPVRDALRRLLAERIIEMDGQRRYRLRSLSRSEFEELLSLRLTLEGDLSEAAAARASDEEIGQLSRIQDELEANIKSDENFLESNQKFHFALYSYARRPVTLGIVKSLWLQVGPLLNHYRYRDGAAMAVQHHHAVIDALQQRDRSAAAAAIRADLQDAARVILDELPDSGPASGKPAPS